MPPRNIRRPIACCNPRASKYDRSCTLDKEEDRRQHKLDLKIKLSKHSIMLRRIGKTTNKAFAVSSTSSVRTQPDGSIDSTGIYSIVRI